MNKGFTLIELIVTIAIIAVLSGIILFSITQYIDKGKDSNISGNLAVLVPAGETWYNGPGNNSYSGFCDPVQNSVIKYAVSQMPANPSGDCYDSSNDSAGVCCDIASDGNSWAACAQEFTNASMAYCVDSRGMKEEMSNSSCTSNLTQCP